MGPGFLIDSNVAIHFLNGTLTPKAEVFLENVFKEECNISIITKMEILGHKFLSLEDKEDAEAFVKSSKVYALSNLIVDTTILIKQAKRIKLPDAIIAATALIHDFTLVTRNTKDFYDIDGLKIVNPMI